MSFEHGLAIVLSPLTSVWRICEGVTRSRASARLGAVSSRWRECPVRRERTTCTTTHRMASEHPSNVWRYPWLPEEYGSGGELGSGFFVQPCRVCDCPMQCAFETFSGYGCFAQPEDCCSGTADGLCQGLPHGESFLLFALGLSGLFTMLLAMLLTSVHSACYGCCDRASSCSLQCCAKSPFVLLGAGIYFFDWLTDANFYVTLSRGDKASAAGYARKRGARIELGGWRPASHLVTLRPAHAPGRTGTRASPHWARRRVSSF